MCSMSQPIINILVVGFHHKKGCQVEYSYPDLTPGNPNELPPAWKYLPALALPDGSHNYHSDTLFFHLPGLTDPPHTVFGVSCFRQIPLDQVTQRTSDMTRSSVQKSVCVISREPLYGRLAVKLELIAKAWFRKADFCNTQLLEDAYRHLNGCQPTDEQILEGLSVTSLLESWRHKIVLLFKLMLLQRKVVVHGLPAGSVSAALLTLLSLLPDCIQNGLRQSANIVLSRPMSPIQTSTSQNTTQCDAHLSNEQDDSSNDFLDIEQIVLSKDNDSDYPSLSSIENGVDEEEKSIIGEREKCHSVGEKYKISRQIPESLSTPSMVREMSINGLANLAGDAEFSEFGLPLKLFSEGHLCLPYLSLQYLDLLSDPAVKGFIIGASNVLFKQKRQLFDVLIESNELRIETADFYLRRQLQLSTEDLRFADHLVRHGSIQGDSWIRDQFAGYTLCLLRTCLLPEGNREADNFNASFVTAFKETDAFKDWIGNGDRGKNDLFTNMQAGHPFAGQLSVTDMKLRLAHTMSSTESGRKVTQAVVNTGRAVVSTSRVVGGALSQAKGALSVWWSSLTTPSPQGDNPSCDAEIQGVEVPPPDASAQDAVNTNIDTLTISSSTNNSDIFNNKNVNTITVHNAADESNSDAEEAFENNSKKGVDLNLNKDLNSDVITI